MRLLVAKDLAPFTKVIAKMELKEQLKAILFANAPEGGEQGGQTKEEKQAAEQKGREERGQKVTDFIWTIIENYHKAEAEFFAFLAGVEGKTAEEIANLPLGDFIALVTELFKEENLPFFKSLAR